MRDKSQELEMTSVASEGKSRSEGKSASRSVTSDDEKAMQVLMSVASMEAIEDETGCYAFGFKSAIVEDMYAAMHTNTRRQGLAFICGLGALALAYRIGRTISGDSYFVEDDSLFDRVAVLVMLASNMTLGFFLPLALLHMEYMNPGNFLEHRTQLMTMTQIAILCSFIGNLVQFNNILHSRSLPESEVETDSAILFTGIWVGALAINFPLVIMLILKGSLMVCSLMSVVFCISLVHSPFLHNEYAPGVCFGALCLMGFLYTIEKSNRLHFLSQLQLLRLQVEIEMAYHSEQKRKAEASGEHSIVTDFC